MEVSESLPVALSGTTLLRLVGLLAGVARLGKVTGEMLLGLSGTVGEAGVVTISELVGSSHCLIISTRGLGVFEMIGGLYETRRSESQSHGMLHR